MSCHRVCTLFLNVSSQLTAKLLKSGCIMMIVYSSAQVNAGILGMSTIWESQLGSLAGCPGVS